MATMSDTLWPGPSVRPLKPAQAPTQAGAPNESLERPFWTPYAAGVLLGLAVLSAFLLLGPTADLMSALARAAGWLARLTGAAPAGSDGGPLGVVLAGLVGVVLGSLLAALGSGQVRLQVERGPRCRRGVRLVLALAGGVAAGAGCRLAVGLPLAQSLLGGGRGAGAPLLAGLVLAGVAFLAARLVRRQWQ
jgi:hypothetical protein